MVRPGPASFLALWLSAACAAPAPDGSVPSPAGGVAASPVALDYPGLLARMVDVDWLAVPPRVGERCIQFSSFDRGSVGAPYASEVSYANGDRGHYLSVGEEGGVRTCLMAEASGPGVVTRIWSANPQGVLHFEVDGRRVWSVPFADLCGGRVEHLGEPMAGVRSKGANCHLPIPFQQSFRLFQTVGDSYYQVNVLQLPEGSAVPSFHPRMLAEHAVALQATRERMTAVVPAGAEAGMSMTTRGDTGLLATVLPGHTVRSIRLAAGPCGDPATADRMRLLQLVVTCGAEETVRVPVADFFQGGTRWLPHRSLLFGIEPDGTAWCGFPMPMPEGGTVRIEGGPPRGALDVAHARVELSVASKRGLAGPMLFRAGFHERRDVATRPFHDHLVLDATGTGRFVATMLLVKNPVKGWWGEGDEKFSVDGEAFPSTFGTGTEDYFGYAWCCPDRFASPYHGQPQCDGPGNFGYTANHRTHVLDAVPFHASFRHDLEVWHWDPAVRMDYASVACWYGLPGARSGLPPVPEPQALAFARIPDYRMFEVPGAIEAESLAVLECTGGRHEVQDMGFSAGFSREAQRWWREGRPGDELRLALPVPEAGRYRVHAQFCTAADYGVVQCRIGAVPLGEPVDLYHRGVAASGEQVLGELELPAGEAVFVLALVGRNPAATAHMAGLDCLRLERLP